MDNDDRRPFETEFDRGYRIGYRVGYGLRHDYARTYWRQGFAWGGFTMSAVILVIVNWIAPLVQP
jgi:hypothetical protein